MHDDELELKVFSTEVVCFRNSIFRSGFHNLTFCSVSQSYFFTILFSIQVDQNLDFMCEVEDGWWKGRLGGRVS